MRIVVQRSANSKVIVDQKTVGEIDKGMVLLVCMTQGDSKEVVPKAVSKLLKLRIFEDESGKMNKNIIDTNGSILAISQFTLSWDGQKGNRPSFDRSMAPEQANELFEYFCDELSKDIQVQKGVFGKHMDVSIENDGPVTFFLEF